MSPRLKKGLVHVVTGNGPGKTTSAVGSGIRAVGHGFKVYMIQFMKGTWNGKQYGEVTFLKAVDNFKVAQFGTGEFVDKRAPSDEDIRLAQKGLKHAEKAIKSGEHDLVILDEILVAADYGLIDVPDVLKIIGTKPEYVELVLTGRNAHPSISEVADYVTDIKEVKHPYQKGKIARRGIEY